MSLKNQYYWILRYNAYYGVTVIYTYICNINLGPAGCRHCLGTEIQWRQQRVCRPLRGRGCQPGPGVWDVQHRQTLGPAVHLCVREQQVRHGHGCGEGRGIYGVLHKGWLHSGHMGEKHGSFCLYDSENNNNNNMCFLYSAYIIKYYP